MKPGVGQPGGQAVEHALRRVGAVGALLEDARDEHDADEHERQRGQHARGRALAEHQPRHQPDEGDLEVAEHRREARPHVHDRVVPADEVGGEEDARQRGQGAVAPAARAQPPVLPPRQHAQDGHGVGAAEDGRRRRRDGRLLDEDGREGDGQRAGDGHRPRARGEGGDDGGDGGGGRSGPSG